MSKKTIRLAEDDHQELLAPSQTAPEQDGSATSETPHAPSAALEVRQTTQPATRSDGTPGSLLRLAVEQGADVDKLERLMAMQERWDKQQAEKAYFAAMNKVQSEIRPIVKDRDNLQTKSRYATLEAVHRMLTPVYTTHGFAISFREVKSEKEGYIRVEADVMHCNGHSRQYAIELALDNKGMAGSVNKTEVHGKGSTISYGRRYLEMQIFNLTVTNEDTDGNQDHPVSFEQCAILKELIGESGADEAKFCEAFKAKTLAEFPASAYEDGIKGLKKKLAKKLEEGK